jgi:hypothetical protein
MRLLIAAPEGIIPSELRVARVDSVEHTSQSQIVACYLGAIIGAKAGVGAGRNQRERR